MSVSLVVFSFLFSSWTPLNQDDDIAAAISMACDFISQQEHTSRLFARSGTLAASYRATKPDESSSSDEEEVGPGRGNSIATHKASYVRRDTSNFYEYFRNQDADLELFSKITHLTRDEFDGLHDLCQIELQKPLNVRGEFDEEDGRVPRKRKLSTKEILFFLFDVFGGSNEGGQGLEHMSLRYGFSVETASNYFRHALLALHKSLDGMVPRLIQWPDQFEREMEGLILGFPSCVFFVDGNKNRRWRPGENCEQERAYDGYKKAHVFALLVFCDLFGRFILIEITDHGAETDRGLYTNSDVYRNKGNYLNESQHGMADMGFAGDGDLVVPYKRNESTSWLLRGEHNREIRKQRMVNEWGIGFINNGFRIFLGRWPFEASLFPIAYRTAAMVSNWQFGRRGYALQTIERYIEKRDRAERTDSDV